MGNFFFFLLCLLFHYSNQKSIFIIPILNKIIDCLRDLIWQNLIFIAFLTLLILQVLSISNRKFFSIRHAYCWSKRESFFPFPNIYQTLAVFFEFTKFYVNIGCLLHFIALFIEIAVGDFGWWRFEFLSYTLCFVSKIERILLPYRTILFHLHTISQDPNYCSHYS